MELSSQLSSNSADISALFTRMGSFEERLQKATSPAQPSNSKDLPALAQEFREFKTLVWQVLSKLKTQMELLTFGQDRHETFLRRKVLLFHGVAETKDEKAHEVIYNILCDKMQLPDLTLGDLQSCHRLGSTSSKPRAVLVRFRDIEHRRLAWDSKTSLKDTGIVISEFLTKSRHEVFMAARKYFSVRNCWSSDGKIVILLPDKTRRKIETQNELRSLMASYPAVQGFRPASEAEKLKLAAPAKTNTTASGSQNVKAVPSAKAKRNLKPRPN